MAEKISWEFKALRITSGKSEFTELSEEQKQRTTGYLSVLKKALRSHVPNPIFSNYHVREAVGITAEGMLPAGNIEYGFCQALHGEEAAVAAFRSHHKRGENPLVLGIAAAEAGDITGPCGNCRDILFDELGPDLEFVSGAPGGGLAVISNLSDYLFDNFQKISRMNVMYLEDSLITNIWDTLMHGKKIENDGYSPKDIHPQRRYFASVISGKDRFFGALDLMADYHPTYALSDAVRQARRVNNPFVDYAIVLRSKTGAGEPLVMYRDRQHLYELNLQQELLLGKKLDPKIYLVSQREEGDIGSVWQTSIKEWLPYPFSVKNFGDEFLKELTVYYKNKITG